MSRLIIETTKKREIVDITDDVRNIFHGQIHAGLLHVFVTHTTAALSTADLDPGGTDQDYLDVFEKLVLIPEGGFRHPHDPEHMPDHVLSTIIGTSVTIPVKGGELVFGTWQRIVLIEFDGPRERELHVTSVASE